MAKRKKFVVKLSLQDAVKILKRLAEVNAETEDWDTIDCLEIYYEDIISEEELATITQGGKVIMIEPTNADILSAIAVLLEK